jgi:hypothetical protein
MLKQATGSHFEFPILAKLHPYNMLSKVSFLVKNELEKSLLTAILNF